MSCLTQCINSLAKELVRKPSWMLRMRKVEVQKVWLKRKVNVLRMMATAVKSQLILHLMILNVKKGSKLIQLASTEVTWVKVGTVFSLKRQIMEKLSQQSETKADVNIKCFVIQTLDTDVKQNFIRLKILNAQLIAEFLPLTNRKSSLKRSNIFKANNSKP